MISPRPKNPKPRRIPPDRPKRVPKLTIRGALDRRMVASLTNTLKEIGEPRRYHWTRLLGFRVDDLQKHIEALFEPGMSWELFLANKIDLDHVIPQSNFKYTSSNDAAFKECWALKNFQPMFSSENRKKGNRYVGKFRPKETLDPQVTSVTG